MNMAIHPSEFVGEPYSKMDCFALVRHVAEVCFNLRYPKLEEFNPRPELVTAEELAKPNWVNINVKDAVEGDVVTLSPHSGTPGHVGIIIGPKTVLHNDKKYGAVIQDFAALRRRGYLHVKAYRWVELK